MFANVGTISSSYIGTPTSMGLALGTLDQKAGAGNAMPAHSLTGVPAGALLVVMTGIDLASANCTVSSSPSLTWTRQIDVNDASAEIHTAVFSAGGSIDVTPDWADVTHAESVLQVVTGQESTLGGASGANDATEGPNFGEGCQEVLTTTRVDSIIFGVVSDRNDISGTITYIGSPTQLYAQQAVGPCFYTFYKSAPTITSYTLGMSSPSTGARMGLAVYEVRRP